MAEQVTYFKSADGRLFKDQQRAERRDAKLAVLNKAAKYEADIKAYIDARGPFEGRGAETRVRNVLVDFLDFLETVVPA